MEPSSSSSFVGDEEDMEQIMRGPEQSNEEKNLALSEPTLPNRQCRICYAPEDASGADPILILECACKGDISYGHLSCLKKWFCKRFKRNGNPDCEICRSPLGARLKKIIRSFITAEVIQHAPRLLILLEVPPDHLDRLQVPLETPDFYQLPSETRLSLEASFERLEQEQLRGQSRRREAFETVQSIVTDQEHSVVSHEDGNISTTLSLDELLVDDFLELSEVHNVGLDPPVARVFTQHPHSRIHGVYEHEGIERFGYPEGRVLRILLLERPEDIVHPIPLEVLLDEVSMHAAQLVDSYGEDLILHPNFMDNLFLEMDESLFLSVNYSQDNDDGIPIAIPVLNPSSDGPDPVFAEAARRTNLIPSRVYTYGRFQMFSLL